jgi:pantetheine-phosphate adenylyltransferase
MRIAVYAGTFDPPTAGHLSVIERAALVFDGVIVVVAVNPTKQPMFAAQERVEMLREATASLVGVECASTEGWIVELAQERGAAFLVRGIRGASDADYEIALANANRALAPAITTVFIPAHPALSEVSSSRLKDLARAGQEIGAFCSPGVERRLRERVAAQRDASKEARHADV